MSVKLYTVETFEPVLTDNLSDGNCFYSAIYRAAAGSDILKFIEEQTSIPTTSETGFIQGTRDVVAGLIREGNAIELYTALKEDFDSTEEGSLETLELKLEGFPVYLTEIIKRKIGEKRRNTNAQFYSYDDFANLVADKISTSGTWASELDVNIVRSNFADVGIVIHVYTRNNTPTIRLPKLVGGKMYLYLYNAGEIHWKHYQLKGPSKVQKIKQRVANDDTNSYFIAGRRRKTLKRKLAKKHRRMTKKK